MPQFDLRGIKCAKYVNTNGVISYTDAQKVGDAMTANLEMRFAEGRLYAESTLAEYMRKATGGTISLGVKYILDAAQKLMFGSKENTRSVTYTPEGGQATTASIKGLVLGAKSDAAYVGVAFYAPDMVDGVEKYTCVFLGKCLFGPPSMSLQTAGENIVFNTPTTSGEFLADDSTAQNMLEVAIADDEAEAIAWVEAVLQ
jgi:hypothetical protein